MWRRIVALCLALIVPAATSAGPLKESAEKAGRELALAQADSGGRSRGRLWTGIALIAGGGVLLLTGRRSSAPAVSLRPGRVSVAQTIRF